MTVPKFRKRYAIPISLLLGGLVGRFGLPWLVDLPEGMGEVDASPVLLDRHGEALHHLIRVHATEGDSGAAKVLAGIARQAEPARQLAYRLYTLCERKGWAEDARAYNGVVTGWSGIEQAATRVATPEQRSLFETEEMSS